MSGVSAGRSVYGAAASSTSSVSSRCDALKYALHTTEYSSRVTRFAEAERGGLLTELILKGILAAGLCFMPRFGMPLMRTERATLPAAPTHVTCLTGSFTEEVEAARAYDRAVLRLRGQDARSRSRMNFPLSDYNLDELGVAGDPSMFLGLTVGMRSTPEPRGRKPARKK